MSNRSSRRRDKGEEEKETQRGQDKYVVSDRVEPPLGRNEHKYKHCLEIIKYKQEYKWYEGEKEKTFDTFATRYKP